MWKRNLKITKMLKLQESSNCHYPKNRQMEDIEP